MEFRNLKQYQQQNNIRNVFSSINGNNRYVEGYFSIYDTVSTKLIFVKGF